MGMLRRFASLAHGERYSYSFDSDVFRYTSGFKIEDKFRMYESLGHGLTQHSNDWPVTAEFLTDYFYSLGTEMLKESDDREDFIRAVGYQMSREPQKETIEFAASVIFNESDKEYGKRRYFSISERKITRNQDKRHDKRYTEISDLHDGSPERVYKMILPEYADGLEMYCYARKVREWFYSDDNKRKNRQSMDFPPVFLEWFTDDKQRDRWDKSRDLGNAFSTVQSIITAWQSKLYAQNELENYQRSLERQREAAAEKAAAEQSAEVA
jgi:hypothetical protein